MPREPQSYGSGSDWVTGRTDQQVNDPKSAPAPEHREFYDQRRDSETTSPAQGGSTSDDVQRAESAEPAAPPNADHASAGNVRSEEGGAKRDSFFRKRDYE